MKKMRRFAAIAAAAAMTACMAMPMTMAFAASGDNSITVENYNPDSAGLTHGSIAAYQVFAGTWNEDTETPANSNLTVSGWGDGIDVDAFLAAIKSDATLKSKFAVAEGETDPYTNTVAGAVAVSDVVSGWTDNSAEAEAFAKLAVANKGTASATLDTTTGKISGIADGYYVIADTAAATDDENYSAWSLGMLKVAGGEDVSVSTKVGLPTVVKKVQEDDVDTDGGYGAGYNDVADWDTNTDVPFKIIGTMPANIADYNHYYLKFTDTMDDTFGVPENIVVTVDGTTLTKDTHYTVTLNGNDMVVEILDVLNVGVAVSTSTKVEINYTAKLNAAAPLAVIGLDGQENKVKMEYSNNPNVTGNGTASPGDDNTGETPEDKVIVFTYATQITKIDGATKAAIEGATFKLANADSTKYARVDANGYFLEWVDVANATVLESDEDGVFTVYGLDDGTYQLYEQQWSTDYNIPTTPFEVVIDATTSFTQDDYTAASDVLKGLTGSVAGVTDTAATATNGTISGKIENNKGTKLPGTGGIGTTLFYVVGGTMVAGASVYLISKKRMKNNQD